MPMTDALWEVYALKYSERNSRTRADSFIFDDDHASPHAMDYFIWVLRSGEQTILVDTGYDETEAAARGRPILRAPQAALGALGLSPEAIDRIIITHLHYDHAGSLQDFPNARLYLQPAEMAFATGPCMCEGVLKMPYTADHICQVVQALYSGRVEFTGQDTHIAPGVSVHQVGGHARGLQIVRVKTVSGWMVLASDATHYYENFLKRKPFPIVVDLEDMLAGFDTIQTLATSTELVIPGHDPLVTNLFSPEGHSGFVWRLDTGPIKPMPAADKQA